MYNNYQKMLIIILIATPLFLSSQKLFSQDVVRCGVQGLTLQQHQDLTNQYNQWLAKGNVINSPEVFYIPIAFHIIRYDNGDANVTDQQIIDQIEVLNASYSNTSFRFILRSIERINNTAWTNHSWGSQEEIQMKQTLAIDPQYILNIYTCALDDGPLGYAWFPWSFPEDSYRHGAVIKYSTLPGGGLNGYNEGDTGTHEVGHYLGLFHTFELGCTAPGDEVDDTPYEESDAHGCPVGRNTCPSPGDDPIHNFMDYTWDSCMDHFTPGQATRMWNKISQYRPSLFPISVTVDQNAKVEHDYQTPSLVNGMEILLRIIQ